VQIILIILAVVYTIVLSLNYIIGVIQTPPGLIFLGSVHYPVDYFYYLSLFAQGQTRWFTAVDLYTHEFRDTMLLGFTNVVNGRIVSTLGFQPIEGYQVALALYTLLLFLLIIKFLTWYFPKHSYKRVIAFALFCVANTFPGAPSFYANIAEPLVRLARVPHKALGLIACILPMLIILKLQDKKTTLNTKIILYIFIGICGVIAANINPMQWLLVSIVLFCGILWHQRSISQLLPVVLFGITGFPMALYLTHLFTIPPFSQSTVWESMQFVTLTPSTFIFSFGPVVLLSILGLPLNLKKPTLPRMFMVLYFFLSLTLFLSPVSHVFHGSNTRFLSAITVLAASVFAADFITVIPIRWVAWLITLFLVAYQAPVFITQFKRTANLATNNAYIYISTEVYTAMMETKKQTRDTDVVLVTWPYDESFPGLTGRRGFMGNPDQTINPELKNQQAYYFFDAKISEEEMHAFLLNNKITYVLSFTGVTKIQKPFLEVTYQNPTLTLYKVLPE
jgi:hypothetical protein